MNTPNKDATHTVRFGFKTAADTQMSYQRIIASYEQNFSSLRNWNLAPLPVFNTDGSYLREYKNNTTPVMTPPLRPITMMEDSSIPGGASSFSPIEHPADRSSQNTQPTDTIMADSMRVREYPFVPDEAASIQKKTPSFKETIPHHYIKSDPLEHKKISDIAPLLDIPNKQPSLIHQETTMAPPRLSPIEQRMYDPLLSQLLQDTKKCLEELLNSKTDHSSFDSQQNEVRSIQQRRRFSSEEY